MSSKIRFNHVAPQFAVTVILVLLAAAAGSQEMNMQTSADDEREQRIREAVESQYIRGLQIRDFSLITAICIPEAKLMGARDGKLRVTTLEKWSKRFDPENPPFEKLEATIAKVDRVGTVAQVRIDFVIDSTTEVTDFLNMVEIEGKWRIVNMVDY